MNRGTPRRRTILGLLTAAALSGGASVAEGDVVLNEINCEGTDWVELVNTGSSAADISGWLLTDDPLGSTRTDHRHLFPASTVIGASDDLVVERGAGGFPFGISCGSDTIRLADATETLVNETAVPELTVAGDTWGRYPNASGAFSQTAPTKGAPNQPSAGGGDDDAAAWMFEPDEVVEIGLDLPQSSIDGINADPGTYVPGTFSLETTGGSYGPLEIGVRLKGGVGSFRPLSGKAAFKLKFNEFVGGQRFLGLEKLTLNNMVQDPSMVHEVLAYHAFRANGIPAPRTGYAYLRVNGADYGLYLNLETVDSVALRHWFDSTKHLYEGEYGADVLSGWVEAFEVDEGSDSDRSDLQALATAVAGVPPGDFSDSVAGLADLQEMTRMWAVERYLGHWDGYSGRIINNYYLHSDSAGFFSMIPWGTDQTFDQGVQFGGPDGGRMFQLCLGDPSCAAMYRQALIDARTAIQAADLPSLANSTAAALAPWQALDPRLEYPLADIDDWVGFARDYVAARPAELDAWLAPPPVTRITSGPRGRQHVRHGRVHVDFGLESSDAGSTFECQLDDRPRKPCSSPRGYWVREGTHELLAWATNPAGNTDQSPAAARFRIVRD